jgi:hypothetical protein
MVIRPFEWAEQYLYNSQFPVITDVSWKVFRIKVKSVCLIKHLAMNLGTRRR